MEYEILYRPTYSLLRIRMQEGESISAESGAMVSMSESIEIQTKAKGGLFGALKRKVLGGESFFVNTFTANAPGEATFAPTVPGDVLDIPLGGRTLYAQSGAYLASNPDIDVDTKWGGAKTFFSREGLFLLAIRGEGHVFVSSYGAIHEISLDVGEKYRVDTGHMVAFEESVNYAVKKVGGWKSTIFSGEGLVCELTGPGKIWMQTRSMDDFMTFISAHMPSKRD